MTEAAIVLACLAFACLIGWGGMRWERARTAAETARQKAIIHSTVQQIRDTVAGMDEDELDRLVYGDDVTPVGVSRGTSDSSRG